MSRFTEAEMVEVWDRWQAGDANRLIGRDISESDVLGWWYSGTRTFDDLTTTGSAAIAWHLAEGTELVELAEERWASQLWPRDPRFSDLLPATDATVAEICRTGSHRDQRALWANLTALRARMSELETEPDEVALRRYVEGVSGQTGERLTVIMRANGLVDPPIRGVVAADQLGVSPQRVSQLADRMRVLIEWATAPAGVWMPQTVAAQRLERVTS